MNKKQRTKVESPFRLTFKDFFDVSIYMIEHEHTHEKLCKECVKTRKLLKQVKKQFEQAALSNCLVWHAYKVSKAKGAKKNRGKR